MELSLWPVFLLLFPYSCMRGGHAVSPFPRFTWIDKYNIQVLFPNGIKDTITLWPAEKVGDVMVSCLYEGVLESDRSSSIAVSGCQNDSMVNIVIYTSLLPHHNMFNLRNGSTEVIDKFTFNKNDANVDEQAKGRLRKRSISLEDDYDEVVYDGEDLPDVPAFLSLDVKLAFEESLLAKLVTEEAAREYIARVFTFSKKHLLHSTLGTSIRLRAQGTIIKIENQHWKPNLANLNESRNFKEQNNMPVTYFCNNDDGSTIKGISYKRKACHETKGVAIIDYQEDINRASQTYIHECGHWFGFNDDMAVSEYCEGTGIMSRINTPGGRPSRWSTCSKHRLKNWLKQPDNNCLKDDSKALQLENTCLAGTHKTVVNSIPKCDTVTVSGADYADCNGEYKVSNDRVHWLPSRPVYKHINLDRYIFWNTRGYGWSIGTKDDLQTGSHYHYSWLDSQEPWEAEWRNGITVNCKGDSLDLDGTFSGTFKLFHLKVIFQVTRNSANKKFDGTLTVEIKNKKYVFTFDGQHVTETKFEVKLYGNVEGQKLEIGFDGQHDQEWKKLEGTLKINYGQYTYQVDLIVDRSKGMTLKLTLLASAINSASYEIEYKRNNDWTKHALKVKIMGITRINIKLARYIKSTWDRKILLILRGTAFEPNEGKLTFQIQEVDANTKRFSFIADRISNNPEKEVLKYVKTISIKKSIHSGHDYLDMEMKANLDLKDSSLVHKAFCGSPSGYNSIGCFSHGAADISISLNLDKPWCMHFLANIDKDGQNVFKAKIDTKSHYMTGPYIMNITDGRYRPPRTFEVDVNYVGKNIVVVIYEPWYAIKARNQQKTIVTFKNTDGKSPYFFELDFPGNWFDRQFKLSFVRMNKNGDGVEDFFDVKLFVNGQKLLDFVVDKSSWPHKFMMEYEYGTGGKIEGTHENGNLHFYNKPGSGKDLEIDLSYQNHVPAHNIWIKVQRNSEVYYEYDGTFTYGRNPSQLDLDANSKMTVSPNSLLYGFTCNNFKLEFLNLCFQRRTMLTKVRANRSAPYKVEINTKVDHDGIEMFKIVLSF